ncbi:MAG: HAD-IA family hydrolase [Propionibacteriaceae bacterium]|jgi:pyrophosphatase PpaX|nr:HAD-IA family hydrolase [Propionibacteriaceae bacterium]
MAPWPVVLCDLDGTLVNTIDLIVASYQHTFRTVLGHEWDEAEIKTWIGQSLRASLEGAARREYDTPGGSDQADRAAEELFTTYLDYNHRHTPELLKEYPGMTELVDELLAAEVIVAAVTSKRKDTAQWALDLANLAARVPLLVSHDDTVEHKPHPEPLLLAARRLGVTPGDCVYLGDATTDLQAAHSAGMASIGVTWGAGTGEALQATNPTLVAHTIEELRKALLGD